MKPLEKTSYREYTYEYIKQKILSSQYQMGERISITQIARELKISNGPVREALSQLQAEGLVETVPFSGPRVVSLSQEDLLQNRIATVTLYLGGYSMCAASGLLDKLAANFESALNAQLALPADAPSFQQTQYSIAVDFTFITTLENNVLSSMANIMMNQAYLESHMDYSKGIKTKDLSVSEHYRILDAIKRRDYSDTKDALLMHYRLPNLL